MKIFEIIFFSILGVVLTACTGIFIFLQVFNTDQYLSKFTQQASTALGRPVSLGHLGLGFSAQGITVDTGPVIISDDADFTAQPFIKVDKIRVSLDLNALIFQRQIHIKDILLQSPEIHFIRSQTGDINIRSFGQASLPSKGDEVAGATVMADETKQSLPPKETSSPLNNRGQRPIIRSVRIQDATISFIDQNPSMPLDIWLSNINAKLNDLSVSKGSMQLSGLSLNIDLSQLDVKDTSPEIPTDPVFKHIKGIVQLDMAQMQISPGGNLTANGNIALTGGIVRNFNIIKAILSHTLRVFGDIDNILSGQLNIKLGSADTVIKKGDVKFSLHDKAVFIDEALIATNIFELSAKGSVDQGLNTDMQTTLHLNTDISAALVNELEGVKYLMDDSKRVTINASLEGVIPHLKYKPNKDFRKKGKKAINAMFRQLFGA